MFPTPPDSCEDSFILFLSGDIFNGSSFLLVVCYPIPADFPSLFINTTRTVERKAQDCTHPKIVLHYDTRYKYSECTLEGSN